VWRAATARDLRAFCGPEIPPYRVISPEQFPEDLLADLQGTVLAQDPAGDLGMSGGPRCAAGIGPVPGLPMPGDQLVITRLSGAFQSLST
jgi:hypothetical protein